MGLETDSILNLEFERSVGGVEEVPAAALGRRQRRLVKASVRRALQGNGVVAARPA
jgi:hypothetical protein